MPRKERKMSDSATPRTAATERGAVGYTDSGGDGPPVLFVHGTPGGWDQAALMGRFLVDHGHRVIAPSRPGYPGTELDDGRATPAQQAGLHHALMTSLGVDRFSVVCWSGGGPSSYQLAIDRPESVRAVVAIAAVSQPYTFEHPSEESALFGRPGAWLMRELARHAPHTTVKALVTEEGDLSKDDARRLVAAIWDDESLRRWVLDWATTVIGPRSAGFANDREQFPELSLDLGSVAAPVLLVHADTDADVPIAHSDHAASLLPASDRLTIEGGTHISVWTGPDQVATQSRIVATLRSA